MKVVLDEGASWCIYWHDDERSILVMDTFDSWTWTDVYQCLTYMNTVARARPLPVYTIIYFSTLKASLIPKKVPLSLVANLIKDEVPNEELIFYANAPEFLKALLGTVKRINNLTGLMPKYRYTSGIEEALEEIARHRANQISNRRQQY